jgi:predicted nuclease of predicted toxin-antitoxin system
VGFGELVAASGAEVPSVVVFRLRNMRPDRVNYYLDRIISDHQEALEQGAIVIVTEGQIRVRLLPILR